MKTTDLDAIVTGFRNQPLECATIENAADRVRARLFSQAETPATAPERLRNCSDFQALIPAYLIKSLSPARSLLLVDHTHSCVECRHALETARSGNLRVLPRPKTISTTVSPITRWAVAAVLVLGVGLSSWALLRSLWVPAGTRFTVQAVNGILYQVADRSSTPIFSGRQLGERELVRTSKGSTAMLRLSDGSLVEMNERSELSVSRSASGTTINLGRGNIIVQAAKQHDGALHVATSDCLVSVKGTVFAVTAAIKGSRVSVVEGQVKVDQGSQSQLLTPGQQTTTSVNIEKLAVQNDVAWSHDSAKYLAVLGELSIIQKGLEQMPAPGIRTSSNLLDYAPWDGNVIMYAAMPNVGATLTEANRLFDDRIQQNPVLKQWWDSQQASTPSKLALRDLVQKIRSASDYIGDEVVLAISSDSEGTTAPLLLAEVKRPGLREYLQSSMSQSHPFRFSDDPATEARAAAAASEIGTPTIFVNDKIVAMSSGAAALQNLSQPASDRSASGAGNGFYNRIHQAYESGATWLFCVNMEQITRNSVRGQRAVPRAVRDATGFNDVRYLILERKDVNGQTKNLATLSFRNNRQGLASWLAAPGPMGSLEFVSADASVAASFVIKNPGALLRELVAAAEAQNPDVANHVNFSLLQDVADALGSDVTFAIDGALLPVPSWKVAVEVYSPDKLEWAFEQIVNAVNQQPDAKVKLTLSKEQVGTRTFYSVKSADQPYEIDYTFVDSYLIAAANRALLTGAIQNRSTGYTLSRSAKFRDQLPRDTYASFSAIIYHDLGSAIDGLVNTLKSTNALDAAQKESIAALQANSAPGLIYAYGEPDRIVLSSNGSLFGLNLNTLALPAVIQQVLPNLHHAQHTQ